MPYCSKDCTVTVGSEVCSTATYFDINVNSAEIRYYTTNDQTDGYGNVVTCRKEGTITVRSVDPIEDVEAGDTGLAFAANVCSTLFACNSVSCTTFNAIADADTNDMARWNYTFAIGDTLSITFA
jgi:hypothetical protein